MQTMMLAGKWVWIWDWQRCDVGDASRVAARLRAAGCAGALVKAFDGPRWFDQGRAWRDIAAELNAHGVATGGWGYCYGNDPAGEAQRAIETTQYGQADLLVLDVEAEFKGNPRAADALCRGIRDALGPEYPLYFSSFAIARYHRSFPFGIFGRYCTGTVPPGLLECFPLAGRPVARLDVRGLRRPGLPSGARLSGRRALSRGDHRLSVSGRGPGIRAAGRGDGFARRQFLVLRAHERGNVAGSRVGDDRRGGRDVEPRIRSAKRIGIAACRPRRPARGRGRGDSPRTAAGRGPPAAHLHGAAGRHALGNRGQLRPRRLAGAGHTLSLRASAVGAFPPPAARRHLTPNT